MWRAARYPVSVGHCEHRKEGCEGEELHDVARACFLFVRRGGEVNNEERSGIQRILWFSYSPCSPSAKSPLRYQGQGIMEDTLATPK